MGSLYSLLLVQAWMAAFNLNLIQIHLILKMLQTHLCDVVKRLSLPVFIKEKPAYISTATKDREREGVFSVTLECVN